MSSVVASWIRNAPEFSAILIVHGKTKTNPWNAMGIMCHCTSVYLLHHAPVVDEEIPFHGS